MTMSIRDWSQDCCLESSKETEACLHGYPGPWVLSFCVRPSLQKLLHFRMAVKGHDLEKTIFSNAFSVLQIHQHPVGVSDDEANPETSPTSARSLKDPARSKAIKRPDRRKTKWLMTHVLMPPHSSQG